MNKIVYNNCYGGFSISDQAVKWLEENASEEDLRKYISNMRSKLERQRKDEKGELDDFFSIEDEIAWKLKRRLPRHNLDLIKCVETLGEDANGYYASLSIEEIEGNEYFIKEYDGAEEVVTPDKVNWITIK